MDTRIYEPVGGGKVTMYYAENFSRVLATADIFVDEEMTTATTDEEFMDAFNSGMVLITIDGTIYTVESVASPDGGSISITVNTDTSGAKYTVYYVAEASMVAGAELELTEIFKDRNLTTAVTMSEFVSAVNSGTVMLFHTSGAYEYHTTIRQVKRVGNTVTVIPDIEEQVRKTYTIHYDSSSNDGTYVGYKDAGMTENFTLSEWSSMLQDTTAKFNIVNHAGINGPCTYNPWFIRYVEDETMDLTVVSSLLTNPELEVTTKEITVDNETVNVVTGVAIKQSTGDIILDKLVYSLD